jgi:hypothetical protein
MIIGRDAVAYNLGEDIRAAHFCRLEVLQSEKRRAFTQNEAAPSLVERPALFRRGRLQGIETDKNELGQRVVAPGQNMLVAARANAFECMADRICPGGARVRNHLAGCEEIKSFVRIQRWFLGRIICDPGGGCAIRAPIMQGAVIFFAETHAATGRAHNGQVRSKAGCLRH